MYTPDGEVAWEGEEIFRYRAGQRYLTVVNAVCLGWCALLDTEQDTIEPIRIHQP